MVSKSPLDSLAQVKLRQIQIRTFIHATESSSKVISPLAKLLHLDIEHIKYVENGPDTENNEVIRNEEYDFLKPMHCTGSHGQKIDSLTFKITNKHEIEGFLEQLAQHIPHNVKIQLDSELVQRMDEKFKIFLRFDKQAAILGNLILVSHSDVYVIILAFQNKNPQCTMTSEDIRTYLKQHQLLVTS